MDTTEPPTVADSTDLDARLRAAIDLLDRIAADWRLLDRLTADERRRLGESDPSAALISATTGEGCGALLEAVASRLALDQQRISLELDLTEDADRDRLVWLYRHAKVHSQVMQGDRAMIEADVPRRLLDRILSKPVRRRSAARA